MTLKQLIDKYKNQTVEAGGSANAKNQCVDLANAYIDEVLGLPKILWTNAIDFPSKAGDKFEFIKNTLINIPNPGDLMIFGKPYGKYLENGKTIYAGHISIYVDGDVNSFTSFDQNYPTGSSCQLVEHKYTNVTGWLRPKNKPESNMSETYKGIDLNNKASVKVAIDTWDEVAHGKYNQVEKKASWFDEVVTKLNITKTDGDVSGDTVARSVIAQLSAKDTKIDELTKQLNVASQPKGLLIGKRKMVVAILTPIMAAISKVLLEKLGVDLSAEEMIYLVLAGLAFIGVEGFKDLWVAVAGTDTSKKTDTKVDIKPTP